MWIATLAAAALVACSGGDHPIARPATPAANAGAGEPTKAAPVVVGVALTVSPSNAVVTIDDVERGPANQLERVIALDPGLHQLIVTLDGYKPYRAEFTVSDKTERFTVRLERAL
ncbi:MAG: PEGA domain-containing protein [Deltaproteobacteria bacterium]|nr:PEGA domain-containing protein [Deltaproteobacteria bacterium]